MWCAWTEAEPEAKSVLRTIEVYILRKKGGLSADDCKDFATNRGILIQGLGYGPLRLFVTMRGNLSAMWENIHNRYAVSNKAIKVQVQTIISAMN